MTLPQIVARREFRALGWFCFGVHFARTATVEQLLYGSSAWLGIVGATGALVASKALEYAKARGEAWLTL